MSNRNKGFKAAAVVLATLGISSLAAGGSTVLATSNLAAASVLTIMGGIFTNIGSDFVIPMTDHFRRSLFRAHPQELNHDMQRALAEAVRRALTNIGSLYGEIQTDRVLKRRCLQQLKALKKEVSRFLDPSRGNLIDNNELKSYINLNTAQDPYQDLLARLHAGYLANDFSLHFRDFFKDNFLLQIQFSFMQVLKEHEFQSARIAFGMMMQQDIKAGLEDILRQQKETSITLSKLERQRAVNLATGLSEAQVTKVRKLVKELNAPKRFQMLFDEALDIKLKDLQEGVEQLRREFNVVNSDIKAIRRQFPRHMISLSILTIVAVITLVVFYFKQTGAPFMVRMRLQGPRGRHDRVFSDNGSLTLYLSPPRSVNLNDDGEAVIEDISSSYLNDSVLISLDNPKSEPYRLAKNQTKIKLERNATIYLPMEAVGLDKWAGAITDEQHRPVAGAVIHIRDLSTTSLSDGTFNLAIPLAKRSWFQDIQVTKPGYQIYHLNKVPINSPDPVIITMKK